MSDSEAPKPVDRVSANLNRRAADALAQLESSLEISKTDVINRALQLYSFLDLEQKLNKEFLVRDKDTGEQQRVIFF